MKKEHNATFLNIPKNHLDGSTTYVFQCIIEIKKAEICFLLELAGSDKEGFYLVRNSRKLFKETFFTTALSPDLVERADSPWVGTLGGFDYLVNIEYLKEILKKHFGLAGSGNPAKTNDWLNLYINPTVSGSGRSVTKHPNANNYDWGMPEELNIGMSDNLLPINARNATGKTPIKTTNNLYVDDTGRYWVAVGPNVMNPNFSGNKKCLD